MSGRFAFCPRCGGPTEARVPDGDSHLRDVCQRCGAVHYVNPRVVVGTAVERGDEVLLCRRAIEPRRGTWTLPGGFLEVGESAVDGARRETREETGVEVAIVAPLVHFDLVRIGQVFMIFRAVPVADTAVPVACAPTATPESLEVRWFAWPEIPWDELSFDATRLTLERLAADRAAGAPRLHYGALRPRAPDLVGPWGTNVLEGAWSVPLGR